MQARTGTTIRNLGNGQFRVMVVYTGNDGSTGNAVQGSHADVLAKSICYSLIAETLDENDAGTLAEARWI